jgi:hypothetical protein
VHALLAGVAFILMNALHVRLGSSFSAALFDSLLSFNHAMRPLWLLPVGAGNFALYYGLLRMVIVRLESHTPGREPRDSDASEVAPAGVPAERARAWIASTRGAPISNRWTPARRACASPSRSRCSSAPRLRQLPPRCNAL